MAERRAASKQAGEREVVERKPIVEEIKEEQHQRGNEEEMKAWDHIPAERRQQTRKQKDTNSRSILQDFE